MKLYLISQDQNSGWDTYDSAVVAAPSAKAARGILPDDVCMKWGSASWAYSPSHVSTEYLGVAIPGTEAGVICASFNAG